MPISHRHHHVRRDWWQDFFGGGNDNHDPWGGNNGGSQDNGDHHDHQQPPPAAPPPPPKPQQTSPDSDGGSGKKAIATVVKTIVHTAQPPSKPTPHSVDDKPPPPTQAAHKEGPKTTQAAQKQSEQAVKPQSKRPDTTSIPTVIKKPHETSSIDGALAKATGDVKSSATNAVGGAPVFTRPTVVPTAKSDADSSASSGSSSGSHSSGGTSAGAKAGIAFGVLGGLFLVGFIVFFLFNRRRKQAQAAKEDEKMDAALTGPPLAADAMFNRSNPKAPRISLRPVTQLFNWNMDRRTSKGAAMALAPAAAANSSRLAPVANPWERPSTSQSTHSNNPFGNQAERVPSPVPEHQIQRAQSPAPSLKQDPFANGDGMLAEAAVAGDSRLTRKTSMRNNGRKDLDLTVSSSLPPVPPSPSGTEFSDSPMTPGIAPAQSRGAAAIAAAGGPNNSTVHRVQLDFIPTMEDEMGLRAGDLVRLLHEYDDGWALCIRLDRSQQGVVPRTCLSTRPVKPRPPPQQGGRRPGPPIRPNGPPRGPNNHAGQRNMAPQAHGRPESPAQPWGGPNGRPMSPGFRSQSPGPRSQSPGPRIQSPGPRSQSPGPRQRGPPSGRSQSPSGMNRRMSPPGPSRMNPAQPGSPGPSSSPRPGPPSGPVGRKPVPGQAY